MLKVLVVNDSRIMLKLISGLLNVSYEVIACKSTDTLDFTDISCMVLDSSLDNWRDISQGAAKAGVPFIVITKGQNQEVTIIEAKQLGACNNIVPPFTKDQLLEKVKGCVS